MGQVPCHYGHRGGAVSVTGGGHGGFVMIAGRSVVVMGVVGPPYVITARWLGAAATGGPVASGGGGGVTSWRRGCHGGLVTVMRGISHGPLLPPMHQQPRRSPVLHLPTDNSSSARQVACPCTAPSKRANTHQIGAAAGACQPFNPTLNPPRQSTQNTPLTSAPSGGMHACKLSLPLPLSLRALHAASVITGCRSNRPAPSPYAANSTAASGSPSPTDRP